MLQRVLNILTGIVFPQSQWGDWILEAFTARKFWLNEVIEWK